MTSIESQLDTRPANLAATTSTGLVTAGGIGAERFLDGWARYGRTPSSARIYRSHLRGYAAWLTETEGHAHDSAQAAAHLLDVGSGLAVESISRNAEALTVTRKGGETEPASPSHRATRVTVLRSVTVYAKVIGLTTWSLSPDDLRRPKVEPYRDTEGPGIVAVVRMVAALDTTSSAGARDVAVIRLLFNQGLRRNEVVTLNRGHLKLDRTNRQGDPAPRAHVLSKGSNGAREWVDLDPDTVAALRCWLDHRGSHTGALFHGLNTHGRQAERLSPSGVTFIVKRTAKTVGIDPGEIRPHGLRHSAITAALDATNGNVRAVAAFARHDPKVTQRYDDNRHNVAAVAATALGDAFRQLTDQGTTAGD